ncbi:tissue inhibitor of metalloproteinase [Ancylostoma ceylanicum]|uniref:Tissue inhibitor of metalloproteinase n=2 Tax=Ancylostoma ceylanicum TaxID=53326 RepID=A0A0D6LRS3_9BILA|nr:tissue inhibitor of metalloproteinase [Ancylostoma ceylanicum]EYC27196.1 hypothetical protein Y032_0009g570 [Ancylostoma ceylanicum]
MQMMLFMTVFFACTVVAHGCSCLEAPLEEMYCRSEYVTRVIVKGEDRSREAGPIGFIVYNVEHMKIYKKPGNVQELSTNVTTRGPQSYCGAPLEVGYDFLIGGSLSWNGMLDHSLCDLREHWDLLSPDEKDRLMCKAFKCGTEACS